MSLILDALKRAERERRHRMPSLADPDPSALSPPGHRGRTALKLALGVVLLLALAALVAWFVRRPDPPPAPMPVEMPAAAPAPLPAIAAPAPTVPTPAVIPGTEGMVSLDELAPADAALPPAAEFAPPPPDMPAAAPTPKPAPLPVEPAPAKAGAPEPGPAAEPPAAATPKSASSPPPVLTQPVPLRRFREMTPEYRADFPAITVEVHVYESSVARRWVMVNGRRYKQGERLAEGPALLEIVPGGLVLEFRGEKLLYPLTR